MGLDKLFNPQKTPAAPPPPPTAADAASAADQRDRSVSGSDQTYASTLLTGAANTSTATTKKNVLLGGS